MENKELNINKVISLEDMLKRKDFFKKRKEEKLELYVKSLDGNIKVIKADKALCIEVSELEEYEDEDAYFVYNVVCEPNLKDPKLHEAFGIVNPPDIVYEIFEVGEVAQISKKAMEFAGFNSGVEIVDEIKN